MNNIRYEEEICKGELTKLKRKYLIDGIQIYMEDVNYINYT